MTFISFKVPLRSGDGNFGPHAYRLATAAPPTRTMGACSPHAAERGQASADYSPEFVRPHQPAGRPAVESQSADYSVVAATVSRWGAASPNRDCTWSWA